MFTISRRRYGIIFVQRRGTPRFAQAAGDAAEISADKPTPTACFIWFPSCKAVAQGTGHGPFHIYGRDSGQPGPAQRCRPLQTADKTVKAKDLSLRGGRRPTWRPEREARGSALGVQSREGSCDFAGNFPTMQPGTARLHPKGTSSRFALRAPRRFAPRNDKRCLPF